MTERNPSNGIWQQQLTLREKRDVSTQFHKRYDPGTAIDGLLRSASRLQTADPFAYSVPPEGIDLGGGISLRLLIDSETNQRRFALYGRRNENEEPLEISLHSPGRRPDLYASSAQQQAEIMQIASLQHLFFVAPSAVENLVSFLQHINWRVIASHAPTALRLRYQAGRLTSMLAFREELADSLAFTLETEAEEQRLKKLEDEEREKDRKVEVMIRSAFEEANEQLGMFMNEHQKTRFINRGGGTRVEMAEDLLLYMPNIAAEGEVEEEQTHRKVSKKARFRFVNNEGITILPEHVISSGVLDRQDLFVLIARMQEAGVVFSNEFIAEVIQMAVRDKLFDLERITPEGERLFYGFIRDKNGKRRLLEVVAPHDISREEVDEVLMKPEFRQELTDYGTPFGDKRLGRVIIERETNIFAQPEIPANTRDDDEGEKLRGQVRIHVSPLVNAGDNVVLEQNDSAGEVIATNTTLYTYRFE